MILESKTDNYTATDVEGIFRLAGAERRIKELVAIFNTPDKYGKALLWAGYSVHDASNVLRRYLNQLPEPIIPLEFYERFRIPLQQVLAAHNGQVPAISSFDFDFAITTYQQLITELPPLNRQLLLYLLDLLAVFAAKAETNRMTSSNLSSIFQPGLLSHPTHDMVPEAYRLSQDVLIFLIEHQDNFLVGMQGTAADEKTIQDVQSGSPAPNKSPSPAMTPKNRAQQLLGRSASVASSNNSARRLDSIRRNASISSRGSRKSGVGSPGPGTPPLGGAAPGKSSGLHRSNTVPSQHSLSPALPSVSRENSGDTPTIKRIATPTVVSPDVSGPATPVAIEEVKPAIMFAPNTAAASPKKSPLLTPNMADRSPSRSRPASHKESMQLEMPPPMVLTGRTSPATTPGKERTLSSLFKQSPAPDLDGRKPNKLQKKRPTPAIISPQGSNQSLGGTSLPSSPKFPPFSPSRRGSRAPVDGPALGIGASQDNLAVRPRLPENYPSTDQTIMPYHDASETAHQSGAHSPSGSVDNGYSSFETADDEIFEPQPDEKKEKQKRRWRISSPKKDHGSGYLPPTVPPPPPTPLETAFQKERSTSTVGSTSGPINDESLRVNTTAAKPVQQDDDERSGRTRTGSSAAGTSYPEKRGLGGWLKGKFNNRDRSGSKERTRSPRGQSPMHVYNNRDMAVSRQSLNAVMSGSEASRSTNRSVEALSSNGGNI